MAASSSVRPLRRPALMISAPSSGQGKTTVTAALARRHRLDGRRIRAFKCGPDFLDPMILARASGAPVRQLDLWLVGEEGCRRALGRAAAEADLIIVEGVMGLFDGRPSAADLAERLALPILPVIDARAMAQTFGAVALGLQRYRPSLNVVGALANRVGSEAHLALLRASLPPGLEWYGALRRGTDLELPSRHLGLVQAAELGDLEARLDAAAEALAGQRAAELPPETEFEADRSPPQARLLAGFRLATARDAAFSFIYQENIDLLEALGAELVFFSPTAGDRLPAADGVWLPGGYPELHLRALAANQALAADLRAHHQAGRPILAECGGLLFLLEELQNGAEAWPMVGLLPGRAELTAKLQGLGLMSARLPEGLLRGHSFHHSTLSTSLTPLTRGVRQDGRPEPGEAVYRLGRLTASYIHFFLPSNPEAAAALFAR
ncbi:MAG: cobyrinate a,c-diamide synthase [Deltaproteobacteria bacterium]|jgi:cobyrinic acid a,c-diamide synthase|nr:cobyrinate a,c-diamide synthase [Deltaproteobacteria bacterium]